MSLLACETKRSEARRWASERSKPDQCEGGGFRLIVFGALRSVRTEYC